MVAKKKIKQLLVAIAPLALDMLKIALTRYTYRVLRDVNRSEQHQQTYNRHQFRSGK